jgi:hypothetical protein
VIALDLPLLAVGTILTVLLFAFGARRLLGAGARPVPSCGGWKSSE